MKSWETITTKNKYWENLRNHQRPQKVVKKELFIHNEKNIRNEHNKNVRWTTNIEQATLSKSSADPNSIKKFQTSADLSNRKGCTSSMDSHIHCYLNTLQQVPSWCAFHLTNQSMWFHRASSFHGKCYLNCLCLMHYKEKGHQHFQDVCYPPGIDRGSQDSVFHISIKCLFSEIVIIMTTKQVLGVAQDGRCIFHCMWVSKLARKLQLAHSKRHRNMTGFPINTNEMLDENRYEEELKSAKLMAQRYVDALKARGSWQICRHSGS